MQHYTAGSAAPEKNTTVLDSPYDRHVSHARDGAGSEASPHGSTSLLVSSTVPSALTFSGSARVANTTAAKTAKVNQAAKLQRAQIAEAMRTTVELMVGAKAAPAGLGVLRTEPVTPGNAAAECWCGNRGCCG